ncbi:hypothetical protein PFICI_08283 [Pestalotiopsis fici W106-1]|uniref:Uncharacterized protein n=1 Tax=Pestalotiopsis fici (strain W106-1 / CGMCC3.15140) TaxID=1229662 RepID=W3X438_PESFW|nr:uncharacterized protein PFICI_08283 [Pestalotiopsis fici W106-1]ETS80754.1 hypothetical protein PFICI_08283 [Pestalotiopsis fici W106-1]
MIWKQRNRMIPKCVRKKNRDDKAKFEEFLASIFLSNWDSSAVPGLVTLNPRKQLDCATPVGVWSRDLTKDNKGQEGSVKLPEYKCKGGTAYCRPDIINGMVNFKIIDRRGCHQKEEDVVWSNGKGLTPSLKSSICGTYDRYEIQHIHEHNRKVAKARMQYRLWAKGGSLVSDSLPPPEPEFLSIRLRQRLFCGKRFKEAKMIRRFAKDDIANMKETLHL